MAAMVPRLRRCATIAAKAAPTKTAATTQVFIAPNRQYGALRRSILLAAALCLAALVSAACAAPRGLGTAERARLAALLPADALLLGEQHDVPEHHRLERDTVQWLATRGVLAALLLEMAEQGHGTTGLPPNADEAAVRRALAWDDAAWPWSDYGPVVMAAVRAGVPVLGANLPRQQLREAMREPALDARLPAAALAEQRQRIREGHCNALPEAQIVPMTRVQIARDIAMAEAIERAAQPGRTVLLVAGGGHVDRRLGVPAHLAPNLKAKVLLVRADKAQSAINSIANDAAPEAGVDLLWTTAPGPPRDYCAEFQNLPRPPRARTQ